MNAAIESGPRTKGGASNGTDGPGRLAERAAGGSAARELREGDVVAAHQDPAPERASAGEAVDPGDGVAAEALLLVEAREELVEVLRAPLHDADEGRFDGEEAEARGEDEPREPHAADRGVEGLGVLVGRAAQDLARGGQERQLLDVPADRPVDVVVLAVDVGGEGAADRHETRPGDDREGRSRAERGTRGGGPATSPPRR